VLVNVNVPENVGIFIPGTFTFTWGTSLPWVVFVSPHGCRYINTAGPGAVATNSAMF